MKKIALLIILLFSISAFSQETEEVESKQKHKRINKFRIGLKAGIPNGVGGGIEFVTPLFKHRVAPFVDYSGFSSTFDDIDVKLQYIEAGLNVYIFGTYGRGLYGSVSYGKLDTESTFSNYETDSGQIINSGKGEFDVSTLNVKAGLKLGRRIYFRAELGYGFGSVPETIKVTGTIDGNPGSISEKRPDIPGVSDTGYVLANIGIGIGF